MERQSIRTPRRGRRAALARVLICVLALWAPQTALSSDNNGGRPIYTLAVVPHKLPLTVHREWKPLADRLSEKLAAEIQIKHYRSIPRFEADILRGVPDLVFMNPYHQVMAKKAQGYVPLVRSGDPLVGIMVVRRDSAITSVKQLHRQILAFPAPNAFGASLYMRALLIEKERVEFTPYYVDAHSEVYRHVILGEATAGGGILKTFEQEPESIRRELRVLYQTPETAPHALAAHPRLPYRLRETIIEEVLALALNPQTAKLLQPTQLSRPQRARYENDYGTLESLGLEKYVVQSE